MNCFICLSLVLVMALISFNQPNAFIASAASAKDKQALAKKAIEQCIKEGKLSAEDTKRIKANELFSSKYKEASEKLQCYLLCYYRKIGIMDAAGKQKPEELTEYLLQRFANKKDKLKPAFAKCDHIKSKNPCEEVYKFEACVLQNL